jgi:hypothetical protein
MLKPLFDICGRDIKAYHEGALGFDDTTRAPGAAS